MKTKLIEMIIIIILFMLMSSSLCFAGWDNTLPADNSVWNAAAGFIRNNWDALEVVLGVDLAGGGVFDVNAVDIITMSPWIDVRYYGATGDGVTDDTVAIQRAIVVARTNGVPLLFPYGAAGTYLITAPLVLASDTLAPVDIIGISSTWHARTFPKIQANMNNTLIDVHGATPTYSTGPLIRNICLENLNVGGANVILRCDWTSGLKLKDVSIRIGGGEAISAVGTGYLVSSVFENVTITNPAGVGYADLYNYGYRISPQCNDITIINGRIYGSIYAIFYGGNTLNVYGLNAEYNQVLLWHIEAASINFIGCHVENTHCIVTNADAVPIVDGNWTDNAGLGNAAGTVTFIGNTLLKGTRSNAFVIDSPGASPSYRLVLIGNYVYDAAAGTTIVTGSFTPTTSVALPVSTRVTAYGNTAALTIAASATTDPTSFINTDVMGADSYTYLERPMLGLARLEPLTLPTGATPYIGSGSYFVTANVGATNVTDILYAAGTAPLDGSLLILVGADGGNTTIVDGATFFNLVGNANFALGDGDVLTLIYSGTDWQEISRSDN